MRRLKNSIMVSQKRRDISTNSKTSSEPQVGDIVLFQIGPQVRRPLLVVSTTTFGTVSGELYLDAEQDGGEPWPKDNLFLSLRKENHIVWVEKAAYGEGIGQWQHRS